MEKKTKEIKFGRARIAVLTTVVLLTVFTYFVLQYNYQQGIDKAGEVLINQVSGVLEKNASAEETLLASLKEDYVIRARAVSYVLENQPDIEGDVEELLVIAELMGIDEIHIFDESGTIYAGTIPKYYGLNIDDGEQIRYFKPMLEDKTLSMCQDVTPNTAEKRSMMYANVWNSQGDKMIQIGIEPKRLLRELQNNQISNVIDNIAVYEDVKIYVVDSANGMILGATDGSDGKSLDAVGFRNTAEDLEKANGSILYVNSTVNGQRSRCAIRRDEKYEICIVQENSYLNREILLSMTMVFGCLVTAALVLLILLRRLVIARNEQIEQLMILTSVAEIYYSMHIIDLEAKTMKEYSAHNQVKEEGEKTRNMDAMTQIDAIMKATMSKEYLEPGLEFTDISSLADRMKGKKVIFKDLLGKNVGWIRMSFIAIQTDKEGRVSKVICTTQIIDEEKRKEERLILESTTDKLTQCFNRRAYENDMHAFRGEPIPKDLVFVSIDVNGLKKVNDSMGHQAGDELLIGAATCMKKCFGRWGKVYRTGGDEFIIILSADSNRLEGIKEAFEEAICSWEGEKVKGISVSCGYVTQEEYPDYTMDEIAKIADDKMYEMKAQHYKKLTKR